MRLISIFLPTFARLYDGHLERAIGSILNQTYDRFELIIIDDASTDGSESLIRRFVHMDARVQHIRMKRHIGLPAYLIGMAYARSKGQLLAFAYDDCQLAPDHLALLAGMMEQHPQAGFVYGQAELVYSGGARRVIGSPYNSADMALGNNHIPNVSAMARRQVIEEVGLYDPHVLLARYYDWDLWRRIARNYPMVFVPRVIATERGVSLPDSIGNTYPPFDPLIFKYTRMARNHKLKPDVFARYDPYDLSFDADFTEEEQLRAHRLVIQHMARVRRHKARTG